MLVSTFQHPCTAKGGEATFYLPSCQVHEDAVSPRSSAKRSPIGSPPHTHSATERVINGQALAMSLPYLCSLPRELPWAGGLWLLPMDTVSALLLEAFAVIFGQ